MNWRIPVIESFSTASSHTSSDLAGFDIQFWSEELNLRTEELQNIIDEVGPSIHEVRVHLAKKSMANWPASLLS
jgi:hypothetical protein